MIGAAVAAAAVFEVLVVAVDTFRSVTIGVLAALSVDVVAYVN